MNTFRAFRHRNYTLFFIGQSVSQIGTWMQRTAVSWVVYTLTHSTILLGMSVFVSQFPIFVFSLWGGVVADRYNRYRILLVTQAASMLQAGLLTLFVLTNHYNIGVIFCLSGVLGIINAYDIPARQPLVHQLVADKSELPNALALNSAMVNFARLAGPALAGILLQQFSAGVCFLLNTVSFVAVIGSLLMLRLPPYVSPGRKSRTDGGLKEMTEYLKRTPDLSLVLLMLIAMSFFVFPFDALLPVFAKTTFHGDAATYGYIRSSIGLGAVISTFVLASLKPGADYRFILWLNSIILGIGIISFSHIANLPIALAFAVIAGFGAMSQSTLYITIIQLNADASMRGRIMSLFAMAVYGMMPLGSLFIGTVSRFIGAPNALLCQGLVGLVIAALFTGFLLRRR
jgi:MFS family permease